MFFWEGCSKGFILYLLTVLLVNKLDIQTAVAEYRETTNMLVLWAFASFLYEVGQLEEAKWDIGEHFSSVWNKLDTISYVLLILGLFFYAIAWFQQSQAALSLAAIPLAISLLQYISVNRAVGELVILIVAMLEDVTVFLVIYFLVIIGFSITFLGMLYGNDGFTSGQSTFLLLFNAALGNYDTSVFNSNGQIYDTVAIVTLVVFVTLTAIVLLNLLIARMSNTHQKIDEKSRQEWSFVKVT